MAAVTDAYATAAEYRAALDKTDASEDTEVLADLTSITRYIERIAKRFFTKDAAAVDRVFMGGGWTTLMVDDIVSVTTITPEGASALVASTYELLPYNAADGSEPNPYRAIGMISGVWAAGTRYTVNGVFGWPAVPAAIKSATIQITALLRLEGSRGISQVTDLGTLISTNPQARHLIDDLVYSYGLVTI